MTTASEIPTGRVVQLHGEINDKSAQRVIAELLFYQMENSKVPITLDIDSPGGSIPMSFAILDTMRFVKCPIWTRCHGAAQGTAAMIFAAGTPGQRKASRDAVFSFTKTIIVRSAQDAKTTEAYVSKMNERLVSELATMCKQQPARIVDDMAAERHFTTDEALKYGLVDQNVLLP